MDLGLILSLLGVILSAVGITVTVFNFQVTRGVKRDVQEVKEDITDFGRIDDDAKHHYQNGRQMYATKDFKNAKNAFEKAIEISANYSQALFFLGHTYLNLGDKVKARNVLQKAVDLGHKNAMKTLTGIR